MEREKMRHFGEYQNQIYFDGLRGVLPRFPADFASVEQMALASMPQDVASYVRAGCGDEWTQQANTLAFRRWGLTPRMMVDTSVRDLSIDLFGRRLPTPIFMAPIGLLGECSRERHGDLDAARAAAQTGIPFTASTLSNDPLEAITPLLGQTPGWFQLYTPSDPELAVSLIERAERAGFEVLVLTLDCQALGWRPRDLNKANFPQLRGCALANYFSDPRFLAQLDEPPEKDVDAAVRLWVRLLAKPLTWADLAWFRSVTRMKIVLKGIMHPDDARRAVDAGADAVYCSNHGGRQSNGGVAAIDALRGIVAAVNGAIPILFDSGVRSGTDIVKALGIGATAVGIGRPCAYGLGIGGVDGLLHVLRSLLAEADLLMAANGFSTIADLKRDAVVRVDAAAES